jgi:hypothetical protein
MIYQVAFHFSGAIVAPVEGDPEHAEAWAAEIARTWTAICRRRHKLVESLQLDETHIIVFGKQEDTRK